MSPTARSLRVFNASNWTKIATASDLATAIAGIVVPGPSSTTPAMDGTAAVGTGTTFARADHVHPVDTPKYNATNPAGYQTAAQVTASLGGYLALSGGIMTGALTPSQTAGIVGTTTNNSVNAGAVGEYVTASQMTNVTMANGVAVNIVSISLTAGDWEVQGNCYIAFSVGGAIATTGVSTVSATLPATTYAGQVAIRSARPWKGPVLATGPARVLIAATTTVYLVAARRLLALRGHASGKARSGRGGCDDPGHTHSNVINPGGQLY